MRRHLPRFLLVSALLFAAFPRAAAEPPKEAPHLVTHTGQRALTSVAVSPDGKRVATGSVDKTVIIWDAATGKELHTLRGHGAEVEAVAFSPDGKRLVTGSADTTARVWDVETGKPLRAFRGHLHWTNSDGAFHFGAVAFSHDGKRVLSAATDGVARLWDPETGRELHAINGLAGQPMSVAISPDGKRFLVGSGKTRARIYDANYDPNGGPTGHVEFDGDTGYVLAVAFAPNGRLALTGNADKGVKLWNANSGREVRSFAGMPGRVNSVAFSPDGKHVLAGGDGGAVRMWETATGKEVLTFKGHPARAPVRSVAFSADGAHVVTAARDGARLWDAATGKEVRRFAGESSAVRAVAFSADGKRLLTWAGMAQVWDGLTGRELRRFAESQTITAARFSPDGKRLVTGHDHGARLWDVDSGEELRAFTGHGAVRGVAVSGDGRHVLTGGADGVARVWDAATGKQVAECKGHEGPVTAVAFTGQGRVLTAGEDKTGRLFDAANGRQLLVMQPQRLPRGEYPGPARAVAISRDGSRVALAGDSKEAQLFDTGSGGPEWHFAGHEKGITSVAFFPNGGRVLTGGLDHTARIFDTKTGRSLHQLTGHGAPVNAVAVSPDGKRVLTGSADQTARLWDAATGKELCRLISFRDGSWAVVDGAGRYDASNGGDIDGLHWVAGDELIALEQMKERYYDPGLLAKYLGHNNEAPREGVGLDHVKLFPKVEISQKDVAKPVLDVALKNRDGGGIGKVVVLVNGKELTGDARPRGADDAKADKLDLHFDLSNDPRVVPGKKNTVEVVAFNADGSLCSRGMVREFEVPGAAGADPTQLYAVVAGVSKYRDDKLNLRYAAKDADDFATALTLAANRFFGADKVHVTRLTGATRPGRAELDKALGDLKATKAGDVIVVYLAGHGVTTGGQDGDWHYLSADAQAADVTSASTLQKVGLSSKELIELLKAVPARKQVMILDTCHSGRLVEKLTEKRDVPGSQVRALERVKDRTGMHVLAGCAADSVSYEATRYGQGLLTYSLLLAMHGAKLREGEYVDVSDLFEFAADKVPELARDIGGVQRPTIASPRGASFPIGRLTTDDQGKVPLEKIKPFVLRSSFQEEARPLDGLGLTRKVDDRLRDVSAARGAGLVFLDAAESADAVRAAGRYKAEGDKVSVSVALYKGDKELAKFAVEGSAAKPDELAEKIAAAVEKNVLTAGGK